MAYDLQCVQPMQLSLSEQLVEVDIAFILAVKQLNNGVKESLVCEAGGSILQSKHVLRCWRINNLWGCCALTCFF